MIYQSRRAELEIEKILRSRPMRRCLDHFEHNMRYGIWQEEEKRPDPADNNASDEYVIPS